MLLREKKGKMAGWKKGDRALPVKVEEGVRGLRGFGHEEYIGAVSLL